MRQIKFRGYSKSYKSWHYGCLDITKDGKCFIKSINENGTAARARVDEESVGQWTGLADCKGNPIYEGDIVEDGEGVTYEVCWDEEMAMFQILDGDFYMSFRILVLEDLEVVGNKYEEADK